MPPSPSPRSLVDNSAFMTMMDNIMQNVVPCNCATCKAETRSRTGTRTQPPKRTENDAGDMLKTTTKSEASGACNHSHSHSEPKSQPPAKKTTPASAQNKPTNPTPTANSGRSDKINALLKADTIQAVFEVLNLTITTKDEKDLATRIQNATKDCKLFTETKEKIVELCDDQDVELDAVFGLLAKFRHERNLLSTAVIKGNSEREKALLCIQRVDHLMYMLHDVAKKKDAKSSDVMHQLGDIIVEIHDLAKTPSVLYDEFLDIKEEHFDLLHDHEEMHQKFVDVNSCHEKLHTSHDKLQSDHTKLQKELIDTKKKASLVGGLKNDITRLEKSVDKAHNENYDLKKEVERLNAELAKVNALKHENAQLKKKVSTLSTPPPTAAPTATEAPVQGAKAQAAKKKRGKKGTDESTLSVSEMGDSIADYESRAAEVDKAHKEQVTKLQKARDTVAQELEAVRANLRDLESLIRKTESSRDRALEKLEVEKATSRNWKDIASKNSGERDRFKAEVDRHSNRAAKLQSTVKQLEESLLNSKVELLERVQAHAKTVGELDKALTDAPDNNTSQDTMWMPTETIRLLRKIRSETNQLARDLDESRSSSGDVFSILDMVQYSVRRVATEVERDIEEILSVRGNDPPISNTTFSHIPETIMPFTHNGLPTRVTPQLALRPEHSPQQQSPHVPPSTTLPPFRAMVPPPGFGDHSPSTMNPFAHNHNQGQTQHLHNPLYHRNLDSPSAPFSRIVEPPGLSSNLGFNRVIEPPVLPPPGTLARHGERSSSSGMGIPLAPPAPDVGVIGSRSTSTKLMNTHNNNATPSPATTPASTSASAPTVSTAASTAPSATGGLGNGAVGVDWNMWARPGR